MDYQEAKIKYIQAWGSLGSSWGVNRTMAQIHALLLISIKPLSTDEIMDELKISRGNTNMNVRQLLDWGLADKVLMPGDRKEYFETDKDVMELASIVAKERKRRELDPLIKILKTVKDPEGDTEEVQRFKQVTSDLFSFAEQADKVLDLFIGANKSWFFKLLSKLKP